MDRQPDPTRTTTKPLAASKCAESAVPCVRTLSEAQVPPLPWEELLHPSNICKFLDALLGFTECCLATSTLVQTLTKQTSGLRALSDRIIRQYSLRLLIPALEHLAASQRK
jgi:hypothetical protein